MAADRRLAWCLNLDADLELAAGARYAPTERVIAAMEGPRRAFAASMVRQGDVVVGVAGARAEGCVGVSFCPTPRALRALHDAGAEVPPAPSVDVLRRVNDRAFCAAIGQTLDGARFVTDAHEALSLLATPPPTSTRWRCKRAFGMAGRGQRVVDPSSISPADEAFVRASFAMGGLQIEPDLTIVEELGLHGLLAADGALEVGAPVRQRCDRNGAWRSTERLDVEGAREVGERLSAELRCVAAALHSAGYFGPFGVDAFTFLRADGALGLQPRSEINARLSMGFAVGFGAERLREAVTAGSGMTGNCVGRRGLC